MNILDKIEPQPPRGIKYMLGDETWLPQDQRSPIRLLCEEWGNLGPMELDPSIKPNKAGFRVRTTELLAPPGALGFTQIDGVYYWTDQDHYGRSADERAAEDADHTPHQFAPSERHSGTCQRCGNGPDFSTHT